MKKKFVSNLILLLALNFLIKPFWIFGIDRTVQNISGAETYGAYFALLNISFLFNIFLDLGITNFNNRNIAQNNQLLNKHFSGIVIMKLFLTIIYLIITLIYVFIFSYSLEQVLILLLLCFNQFLASFVLYLRSNISGLLMFKTDSLLSVLDRLIMIFICSLLLWGNITHSPFKIEWFIYAQTVGYFVTFILALFIVVKKAAFVKIRWNIPFYIVIFRHSFPFALLVLLMNFYYRIDGIMLERMLPNGAEQSGIYAAAFRILDAGFMLAYLFSVLLLPIFSRMLKEKSNIEGMLRLSFTLIAVPSIIFALVSFLYKTEIMSLLYHAHIEESAQVFGILMLCFVAISVSYIFSTLLTANGSLKTLNIIAFGGMFINISLNLILIPRFQSLGSAYASFITQFTVCALQIVLTIKIFKIKPNYKFLSHFLAFIVTILILGILIHQLEMVWYLKFSTITLLALFCALIFRIFTIKDFLKVFLSEKKI